MDAIVILLTVRIPMTSLLAVQSDNFNLCDRYQLPVHSIHPSFFPYCILLCLDSTGNVIRVPFSLSALDMYVIIFHWHAGFCLRLVLKVLS